MKPIILWNLYFLNLLHLLFLATLFYLPFNYSVFFLVVASDFKSVLVFCLFCLFRNGLKNWTRCARTQRFKTCPSSACPWVWRTWSALRAWTPLWDWRRKWTSQLKRMPSTSNFSRDLEQCLSWWRLCLSYAWGGLIHKCFHEIGLRRFKCAISILRI